MTPLLNRLVMKPVSYRFSSPGSAESAIANQIAPAWRDQACLSGLRVVRRPFAQCVQFLRAPKILYLYSTSVPDRKNQVRREFQGDRS